MKSIAKKVITALVLVSSAAFANTGELSNEELTSIVKEVSASSNFASERTILEVKDAHLRQAFRSAMIFNGGGVADIYERNVQLVRAERLIDCKIKITVVESLSTGQFYMYGCRDQDKNYVDASFTSRTVYLK